MNLPVGAWKLQRAGCPIGSLCRAIAGKIVPFSIRKSKNEAGIVFLQPKGFHQFPEIHGEAYEAPQ
ncbi:MAG TPA: hypothetical protein DIT55_01820, partial [Spirochaetaceae bacterium]|nr:hypothetical protein [Spirochaetaceae bacterium]